MGWREDIRDAKPGDTVVIKELLWLRLGEKFPSRKDITIIIDGPYIPTCQIFNPKESNKRMEWWGNETYKTTEE